MNVSLRNIIPVLLMSLPLMAQASLYQNVKGDEVSFIPVSKTDISLDLQKSLVRIEFDVPDLLSGRPSPAGATSGRGHCSGVYISRSRDILTAAHCFDECLFKSTSAVGKSQSRKTCSVRINGEPAVVQVEVMSKCPLEATQDVKIARALGQKAPRAPASCGTQNDVAVVRPISPLSRPYSCLPLQAQHRMGEPVFTLGHPGYSSRSDGRLYDSDGKRPYYSRGKIVQRAHCLLKQRWENTNDLHVDGIRYSVGSFVHLPNEVVAASRGKLQATVDAVEGSSGSPLLNAQGEIVGVTSFVFTDAQGPLSQCEGATFFEPAANVQAQLTAAGRSPASLCR